jgi:tetratricopeptide (TPR) repeat protein
VTLLLRSPGMFVEVSVALRFQPAAAQSNGVALFEMGSFVEAFEVAELVPSGASQLLTAQAAIAQALYVAETQEDQLMWLERALDAAHRATEMTPDAASAWLELAHARGEIAFRTDVLQNLDAAVELRDMIDRALMLDPDHPNALVALGMWHLGLTGRGEEWLFGARRDDVLDLVERGVSLGPRDIELRIEYAKALLAFGAPAAAREQLEIAIELPVRTAVDGYQRTLATAMLEDIERGAH